VTSKRNKIRRETFPCRSVELIIAAIEGGRKVLASGPRQREDSVVEVEHFGT